MPPTTSSIVGHECALVSSSGVLLARMAGTTIDRYRTVARVGLSPTKGFEMHVGSRTDVRFVQLSFFEAWRNNSHTKLLQVLRHDRLSSPSPRVQFMGTTYEIRKLKLKSVLAKFIRHQQLHLEYSTIINNPKCNMAGCRMEGRNITRRYPSSGVLVLQSMFDVLNCSTVHLFGFSDVDHGIHPYHYWSDGSVHDAKSSMGFYRDKLLQSSTAHDFEAEHWFLFNVLGERSWRVNELAYRRECVYPQRAPRCRKKNG